MDIFNVLTMIGGLCLFLFGMNLMGQALERRAGGKLQSLLDKMTGSVPAGFLTGLGITAIIQSSSATIGILQALSMTGVLTFGSVYAIIIGVNIGDCVTTAIVCSIGSKADAKRTGVVHIIFNLCASVIIITALTVLHLSLIHI